MDEVLDEIQMILDGRLREYVPTVLQYFVDNPSNSSITATEHLGGVLYRQRYKQDWKGLIPYCPAFYFLFSAELNIANLLNESALRVEDRIEALCERGYVIGGVRVLCRKNTHLCGRMKQVLILLPDYLYQESLVKKQMRMAVIDISLTKQQCEEVLVLCPECSARAEILSAYSRFKNNLAKMQ